MTDESNEVRIKNVRVTNGLDVPFTDRYDGIPLRLLPGESRSLQLDMAAHFFGYHAGATPEHMMRHICKRQGWNGAEYINQNPENQKTRAQELFEKLRIEPVMYKLVEVQQDPTIAIPADPQPEDDPPRRGPGRPRNVEARV